MRLSRSIALLASLALPIAAAHAAPIVYNAASQFSTASNPNGAWVYGYGTPGSTFTAATASGSAWGGHSGYEYWAIQPNALPVVGLNTNSSPTPGFTPFPPTTDLWMHPGPDLSNSAIVEFIAPDTGTYNIAGFFRRVDQDNGAGNGVGVAIYDNGAVLLGRTLLPPTTYLGSISFNDTLFLTAGSILSFDVDNNGDINFDSTGLNLTVTENPNPIPEPSSLLLLGSGFAAAATALRRRPVR